MSFWGDDFDARWNTGRRPKIKRIFDGEGHGHGRRQWVLPGFVALAMASIVVLLLLPFVINNDVIRQDEASLPALAQGDVRDSARRIVQVADQVKPAVVSVINHPEELDGEDVDPSGFGLGSGIIFAVDHHRALVVTNHHVIEGGAEYEVVLTTGERRKAKLIGSDRFTDVAVMSIDSEGIKKIARFGDSDKLEAGESVVAIGNPLGISYSQTITAGIISSLRTPVPISLGLDGQIDWEVELIQTDAAINRGNSGGALVNLNGEVIGINSMKVADFGVEGLGFAIPINEAVVIMESLLEHGKVRRPFIGVGTQDLFLYPDGKEVLKLPDEVEEGVIIINAEGPAKDAGLKTGDVIVRLDDAEIDSTLALRKYLYEDKEIGDDVKVTFYREGKKDSVILKLVEREE